VPCLNTIPKISFETLVKQIDEKLEEINNVFSKQVPIVINKKLSDFCHDDTPIVGGLNYDQFTGTEWFNRPELYCNNNANRLVIIPNYKMSHCFFSIQDGNIKYTAKIPFNPTLSLSSYHGGTTSKTVTGMCEYAGDWTTSALMKISEINTLASARNGIIYYTELDNKMKLPCTSAAEKIIGNNINRRTEMPLCSNFLYLNQIDCEQNNATWDSQVPLQMLTQYNTIDLHKEDGLEHIYFTESSASSYMRFCLATEYSNPTSYVSGENFGFSNIDEAHKVNIEGR